jgi:AcrR family transcriptional regulator
MFAMAYPVYVREKARRLRVDRELSIDEIAERLALPKTTIYHWVRDLPLNRARRENPHPATVAMQRKFRLLREAAYDEGWQTFDSLAASDPTFRDFVCMYVGEGSKRDRNNVAICNSDPRVVLLAARWLRALSRNPVAFALQYHADQDPSELRKFWGRRLEVDPASISIQRKSNSGQLRGRTWRSKHGVLTVRASDTQLRARIQGWMDRLQEQWLDSTPSGA